MIITFPPLLIETIILKKNSIGVVNFFDYQTTYKIGLFFMIIQFKK